MPDPIRNILVPTDFSELSRLAVETAANFAEPDQAKVHLLHVIRLPIVHTTYDVNIPERVWEGLRGEATDQLEAARELVASRGAPVGESIVGERLSPEEEIVAAVERLSVDLVVMATHGRRGLAHAFLGSVTERTLRTAPVPVLCVKGGGLTNRPPSRILMATDFTSHADRALELAIEVARRFGAHLDLLHVFDTSPPAALAALDELVVLEAQARDQAVARLAETLDRARGSGVSIESHLADGIAADHIAERAESLQSDLIVMGTHGHTGWRHISLGSVAERTLRLAPCAVLTTRAPED